MVQPFPSTRRVLRLLLTSCDSLLLALWPHKISLGKNTDFPPIYPPFFTFVGPSDYWNFVIICTLIPNDLPEKVSVRRTRGLLGPSFSLLLAEHTLGFANSCHQRPSSGLSPYSLTPMPDTHKKRECTMSFPFFMLIARFF